MSVLILDNSSVSLFFTSLSRCVFQVCKRFYELSLRMDSSLQMTMSSDYEPRREYLRLKLEDLPCLTIKPDYDKFDVNAVFSEVRRSGVNLKKLSLEIDEKYRVSKPAVITWQLSDPQVLPNLRVLNLDLSVPPAHLQNLAMKR